MRTTLKNLLVVMPNPFRAVMSGYNHPRESAESGVGSPNRMGLKIWGAKNSGRDL